MKLIATFAIGLLFAGPALAEKWAAPFVGKCTTEFADIEMIYGPLEPRLTRISTKGFGITFATNDAFEVLIIAPDQHTYCVLWDNLLIEGEAM